MYKFDKLILVVKTNYFNMKVLIVAVLVFAAFLQADARSIGISQELPKVLKELMEQSSACAMQMGPNAANIPRVHCLQQLPEDNEALNELWGCLFVKKGLVNHDNEINPEKLHIYLMDLFTMFVSANNALRTMADDITDTCKDVEAGEYKLKSIRLQNCINHNVKEKTGQ